MVGGAGNAKKRDPKRWRKGGQRIQSRETLIRINSIDAQERSTKHKFQWMGDAEWEGEETRQGVLEGFRRQERGGMAPSFRAKYLK